MRRDYDWKDYEKYQERSAIRAWVNLNIFSKTITKKRQRPTATYAARNEGVKRSWTYGKEESSGPFFSGSPSDVGRLSFGSLRCRGSSPFSGCSCFRCVIWSFINYLSLTTNWSKDVILNLETKETINEEKEAWRNEMTTLFTLLWTLQNHWGRRTLPYLTEGLYIYISSINKSGGSKYDGGYCSQKIFHFLFTKDQTFLTI